MLTVEEAMMIADADSQKEPNSGCWLWMGALGANGYAYYKSYRMSRLVLGLPKIERWGMSRETLLACHRCDTPSCVNPAHLFSGTPLVNVRDGIRKGRIKGRMAFVEEGLCGSGHAMTPQNSKPSSRGNVQCRICFNAKRSRLRRVAGPSPSDSTAARRARDAKRKRCRPRLRVVPSPEGGPDAR
jgi:hypothetical protein